MKKEIYNEENGLTYILCGDYYIPKLALPDEASQGIGKYGMMRRAFLKEHRPASYEVYILNGTLWKHLAEVDSACNQRLEQMIPAIAVQEGVTEALKAKDQMDWVGRMNNIKARAEEVLFAELIYV